MRLLETFNILNKGKLFFSSIIFGDKISPKLLCYILFLTIVFILFFKGFFSTLLIRQILEMKVFLILIVLGKTLFIMFHQFCVTRSDIFKLRKNLFTFKTLICKECRPSWARMPNDLARALG
jgi:hypothetical protein